MDKYDGLNIEIDLMTKKRLIFSSFFILGNRIQTNFDNYLEEITSKQWLIMIIVSAFPYPPSLTEVAEHAGCSRQNVKKITVVLEKKGFIELKQERDSRAVCIVLTQKFYDFYKPFLEKSIIGIEELFEGMNESQIEELFYSLHKIEENINEFEKNVKNKEIARKAMK